MISVRPNGQTRKVSLVETPTSDDDTRGCIIDAVRSATFPTADRPYEVVVPVHFDLRSDAKSSKESDATN